MLFTSFTFLYFFLFVFVLRWSLPSRWVPWLLLGASYVFYLSWQPVFGFLIAGMTLFAFMIAKLISLEAWKKKFWLVVGVSILLGVLAYFKYRVFFYQQWEVILLWLGWQPQTWTMEKLVLPLGISFFTFQLLAYIVDVYRGTKPEQSFFHFALFISFFPQLIAGPIVRTHELLEQLKSTSIFQRKQFLDGMDLLMLGLVKKLVFAENFALYANPVFADPSKFSSLEVVVGVLAFSGQIYCDFSGYTDIAIGAAKLLGFDLPENFRWPYLSKSITEFWRRWHITLSQWLRDYLYIPLGGNRHGRTVLFFSLMMTMALGGLWHGASWNFVIWGVFHGVLLILHRVWSGWSRLDTLRKRFYYKIPAVLCTFVLVSLGWIFFRAATFAKAMDVFQHLFVSSKLFEVTSEFSKTAVFLGSFAFLHWVGFQWQILERIQRWEDSFIRGLCWFFAVILCYFFAIAPQEFIYFQF